MVWDCVAMAEDYMLLNGMTMSSTAVMSRLLPFQRLLRTAVSVPNRRKRDVWPVATCSNHPADGRGQRSIDTAQLGPSMSKVCEAVPIAT